MKSKVFIAILISVVLAYFARTLFGVWLAEHYAYSGSFFWGFSNPEDFDGFLFSYIFLSSLLVTIFTGKIRLGLYATLPVLVLDLILGAFNPQLWIDLVLLAVGLALAWVILKLKKST